MLGGYLAPRMEIDAPGRRFDFVQAFPSAPLAGLHWFVYRNAAR
jgi:hypothetical protein